MATSTRQGRAMSICADRQALERQTLPTEQAGGGVSCEGIRTSGQGVGAVALAERVREWRGDDLLAYLLVHQVAVHAGGRPFACPHGADDGGCAGYRIAARPYGVLGSLTRLLVGHNRAPT